MYTELLSNLIIQRIISVNTIFSDAKTVGKRQNRLAWAILWKYEGETEYLCKGRKYFSNANQIVILPKGSSYQWTCIREGHYYIVEFDSYATHDEILSFTISDTDKILSLLKILEFERIAKNQHYQLKCINDTYSLLLMLLNPPAKTYTTTDKKEKIQNVLDYIAQNYTKSLKNDDLAALTPFSTVYFRKLFRAVTDMSPVTYLHTLRINKAKEMLTSDYSSISDIAYSLGYSDIYDFSRTFKKYVGMSPTHFSHISQYRQTYLQ